MDQNVEIEVRERLWLPLGTVVILKNGTKEVEIIGRGVVQKMNDGSLVMKDYVAVLYPEGYQGPDLLFMFDDTQIKEVVFVGYEDEANEQYAQALQKRLDGLAEQY